MQVEPDDVAYLVHEVRVGGELEAFGAMWRQREGTPDARDRGLAQSQMGCQQARRPMRGAVGHGSSVAVITASTCVSRIVRGAPEREASSRPGRPCWAKRLRHFETVVSVQPPHLEY